ncbi:MAG: hypothetical protein HQL73_03330 [Magnetococcales bacterium]|nr:hypothetical protein [Magnetococcales bacterium]
MLEAWERGTLTILPVFVRPSGAEETRPPFNNPRNNASITLTTLKGFASPQRTLAQMKPVQREIIFQALASRIRELVAPLDPEPKTQDAYSQWALAQLGRLSLLGWRGGDIPLDLERVYIPLRISQRAFGTDLENGRTRARKQMAREQTSGDVERFKAFYVACRRKNLVVLSAVAPRGSGMEFSG